ncbi:MAG: hypothetical protein FWD25_02180 [Clostridia bacterium]|nr:hypothetical protein [Clostridia bacterium]
MKFRRFWHILALCLLLLVTNVFAADTTAPAAGSGQADDAGNSIRVLIPNTEHYVVDVWKEGDDFRVLVLDDVKEGEKIHLFVNRELVEVPEAGGSAFMAWRRFADGIVGDYTEDYPYLPAFWHQYDPEWLIDDEDGLHRMLNSHTWQVTWNDYLVRSGEAEDAERTIGLWLVSMDQEPIFVHFGTYVTPIVVPGSDEVISTKFKEGEGIVYTLIVSVDLNTFEEEVLLSAFPNSLTACAYLDGKLLIRAVSHEQPDVVMYALADPMSNEITQVDTSIGGALTQTKQRPLQSAGKPGEYYIVIDNYLDMARDHSTIGRFNVHDLSFEHMLTLNGVIIDQSATWVDAETKTVYSCYDGELVAFLYTDP